MMKTVSAEQLRTMMEKQSDLLVINTLNREAFEQGHIPNTRNVPRDDNNFEEQVEKIAGSKDRNIVVYCASDACDSSSKAARDLEKAGFSNVYDFEGGTKGWQKAGHVLSRVRAAATR